MQDAELLRDYVTSGSDRAFAELVDRYVDFVYSTARRQLGNAQLAEEVAQMVFSLLARKAVGLVGLPSLAGWLYRATCFTAAKTLRTERRRRHHEHEAATMNQNSATDDEIWEHLSPMLDDALNQLEEQDRLAVFLRFFQKKPMREVGETLGVSEAAAKMRVSRAVERLREFFSKRGVAVGASGLTAVLSANAVQAAPVGLSAAISIGAALSGAAVQHAGTIGLTKTLAMTTIQKTLVAATLAAAVGTGIYEARRISLLTDKVEALQQQQAPLTAQVGQLRRQRDDATGKLAALEQENERLRQETSELAKLRGEVARHRSDSQELAKLKAVIAGDQTLSGAASWKDRVSRLKERLEQTPGARIPELQLLTEKDWLHAARGELETDADYRRALSTLRSTAENQVAQMMKTALTRYLRNNSKQFPSDLAQLQPYFDSPLDDSILQRWEIAPAQTVKSLGLGGDVIITQRAPVDDVFDTRFGIGPNGFGSTDFLEREIADTMNPVWESFRTEHNGEWPEDVSELLPYAKTSEQQVALQKLLLKRSSDTK
jgi:RNA polymerase sigma factor (sigma-70 family)